MTGKRKKTGICALCASNGLVTKEHVPPKNLFLKPRPRNTLTVGLCAHCNHSFHLDDEYFRIYVAAVASPGTALWRLWKEKVVGSSFRRGGGLKARLSDDRDLIVKHHQSQPLKTYNGQKIPNELLPRVQPFDANRINSVVTKIVRCLHFHHQRTPLGPQSQIDVDIAPISNETWRKTLMGRSGEVGLNNEFVYRFDNLASGMTVWVLLFYERHAFTVYVQPSD